MLALMVALVVSGAVVALVLQGVFVLARRLRGSVVEKAPWWEDFVTILLGVGVFGFLSHFSWQASIGRGVPRVLFFGALILLLFFLVRKAGWKIVNLFLAVFIVASLGNLALAEIGGKEARRGESMVESTGNTTGRSYGALLDKGGKLQSTPNVYVFFLESFHNRDYLRSAYGFDSPEFYDFLAGEGFVHSPKFFSSHSFTLASALALLDVQIVQRGKIVGVQDLRRDIRVSLGNNAVFKFFHNNGYRVNVFDDSDYTFRFDSPYIDFANFYAENRNDDPVIIQAFEALNQMNSKLEFFRKSVSLPVEAFLLDYPARFDMGRPNLFFLHFGANHSDHNVLVSADVADKWKAEYKRLYEKACANITTLVGRIREHDSSALVVMLGDHGAYLYPYASDPAAGVSAKVVATDYSSVFQAVKWPEGFTPHPEPRDGMNTIRIFPYIVSNLQSTPLPDAEYPPLDAFSQTGLRTIKNGEFLEKWEDVE